MKKPNTSGEIFMVGQIAAMLSIAAFFYYLRHDDLLLYGDAVAHINIARRVVDSLTPGPLQLGTVWLPLPHLITIPFVLSDWAWRTGVAGSIGSMMAYGLGVMGIFRLVLRLVSRPAACLAAAIYACNPNLSYMQATAMTESIYLAAMIWAVTFLIEFVQALDEKKTSTAGQAIVRCALALAAAMLTRYDGWFLAAVMAVVALYYWLRSESQVRRATVRALILFVVLVIIPPLSWFAYNWRVYNNPL